jgi:hypothetical protein
MRANPDNLDTNVSPLTVAVARPIGAVRRF